MPSKKSKIFISYARMDSNFALKLGKDLRDAEANIWIDQLDIPLGENWDDVTEEALEDCESVILILSPTAVASKNVKDEINFALEENNNIYPIVYQECKVPLRIRRIQRSDFSKDYENGLKQLLSTIGQVNFGSKKGENAIVRAKAETTPAETYTPLVFICHASEDKLFAKQLYDRLKKAGLNPWLDSESIRGGDSCYNVLKEKIENSDYFVVLQSKALEKLGVSYVNKEIHIAKQRQQEFRQSDSFIIPIQIEECTTRRELKGLQTIDFRRDDKTHELISVIKRDQQRRRVY